MVPSIPEGGTKSRVETQIRVTIDLADASATSGDPYKYDRVGSWKWLKLPSGTATKRRTRKQGKIGTRYFSFGMAELLTFAKIPSLKTSCISPQPLHARLHHKIVFLVAPAVKPEKYAHYV